MTEVQIATIDRERQRLRELVNSCVQTGKIVLSSGKETDFYFDGRTVSLTPEGSYLIARVALAEIAGRQLDAVGGPTSGADPMVSSIGVVAFQQKVELGLFYVRKDAKAHGMCKRIEGPELAEGARVFLVDDVLTSGGSLLRALQAVREDTPAKVIGALVLVDREEGGREALEAEGIEVVSLFKRSDFSILTNS